MDSTPVHPVLAGASSPAPSALAVGGLRARLSALWTSFDPRSRGAGTTRAEALATIRNAASVFIAYSHADLTASRRLRKRILRLRRGKSADSVFLDQDSLPPGSTVSPQRVDDAIARADLMVVVCGKTTAKSLEVHRELELAFTTPSRKILPIVLEPKIVLPARLDYRVQGIFLTHLFPSIAYAAWGVLLLIVALSSAAGLFYGRAASEAERATRENSRRLVLSAYEAIKNGNMSFARTLLLSVRAADRHWEWAYLVATAGPEPVKGNSSLELPPHLQQELSAVTPAKGAADAGEIIRVVADDREAEFEGYGGRPGALGVVYRRRLRTAIGGFQTGMYGTIHMLRPSTDGSAAFLIADQPRPEAARTLSGDVLSFSTADQETWVLPLADRVRVARPADGQSESVGADRRQDDPAQDLGALFDVSEGPTARAPVLTDTQAVLVIGDAKGSGALRAIEMDRRNGTFRLKSAVDVAARQPEPDDADVAAAERRACVGLGDEPADVSRRFVRLGQTASGLKSLVYRTGQQVVEVWNCVTRQRERVLGTPAASDDGAGPGHDVAVTSDGRLIAAYPVGSSVALFDASSGRLQRRFPVPPPEEYDLGGSLSFSPDGARLVFRGYKRDGDNDFYVWDTSSGAVLFSSERAGDEVLAMEWDRDQRLFVHIHGNGDTYIDRDAGGPTVAVLRGLFRGRVGTVHFQPDVRVSPDGTRLKIGGLILDRSTFEVVLDADERGAGLMVSDSWKTVARVRADRQVEFTVLDFADNTVPDGALSWRSYLLRRDFVQR